MHVDWQTALVPFLIVLVPIILAKLKQVFGDQKWLIPIAAPVLGAVLDVVSYYTTNTTVGTVQAAALGALGVWLREVIDQLRQVAMQPMIPPPVKKAIILTLVGIPLFASCSAMTRTTVSLVTGQTLDALGQEFVSVANTYNQLYDTGKITKDEYRKFVEFGKQFKFSYPLAVQAWKAARDANDIVAQKKVEDVVIALTMQLSSFASTIYDYLKPSPASSLLFDTTLVGGA